MTGPISANLLLFEVVFDHYVSRDAIEKIVDPVINNSMVLLNERPGLQRITYAAKFDIYNRTRLFS